MTTDTERRDAEMIAAIEKAYNAADPGQLTVMDGVLLRNGLPLDKAYMDNSAQYFAVIHAELPRLLELARDGLLARQHGGDVVQLADGWYKLEKLPDAQRGEGNPEGRSDG